MDFNQIVGVYVEIIEFCIPVACVFGFGNLIVNVLLSAAFGGRLKV